MAFLNHIMDCSYRSDSGQILTGPGVDLQLVADIDEQRNHDLSACLYDSRLGSTCSGVALDARLSLRDFQLNKKRSFECLKRLMYL